MEIVINKCYGGFGLSYQAVMEYAKLKGIKLYAFVDKLNPSNNPLLGWPMQPYNEEGDKDPFSIHYYTTNKLDENNRISDKYYFSDYEIARDDPILIKVVKKLKQKANGMCAKLSIVTIPDGIKWAIEEYDGQEWVAEQHETWS